jgi:RimJ/RimL family protein N-acetyltransferase
MIPLFSAYHSAYLTLLYNENDIFLNSFMFFHFINRVEKRKRGNMSDNNSIVVETERLIICKAAEGDADFYYQLWTNPDVMRNVGFPQGMRVTREEIEKRLQAAGASPLGRLLVARLEGTRETIGECWMDCPNEEGISETDVKLLPRYWGNRYGVEIKRALVAYLFTHTQCRIIQASPNVENIASIRMQEAAGAVRIDEGIYEFPEKMRDYTAPVYYYTYQVHREEWEKCNR